MFIMLIHSKVILLNNISQIMAGPLMIGTFIWLVLAIVAGWLILKKVEQNSTVLTKQANTKIAYVGIIIGAFQMWLMWLTCYMHQMYPLIRPKIEFLIFPL